jgi:hypothetical protein
MQIRICKLHEEKFILTLQRNLFSVGLYRDSDKKVASTLKKEGC